VNGSGSVSSNIVAIDCPATSGTDTYTQGTVVTLTAVADTGSPLMAGVGRAVVGPVPVW